MKPMPRASSVSKRIIARRYTISGHVQGVGFRPFVYQLAQHYAVQGWVENGMGQVFIHAQGPQDVLDRFAHDVIQQAPAVSHATLQQFEDTDCVTVNDFSIHTSDPTAQIDIRIIADLPLCEACRREMFDPDNRRYRYPFINCTHCGPRYSLLKQLPYDRSNTTMANFKLCDACEQEYKDPTDRRFHAEPVACADCGPSLYYTDANQDISNTTEALQHCVAALRAGAIVAVKGVGGYHLMCDARNETAVAELRKRKQRPHKPLAVMLAEKQLNEFVNCEDAARKLLTSRIHPIVLLEANSNSLAGNIAPGLNEIGIMLPYSPLHELLLTDFAGPLVATSANISGEPVLTDNDEVAQRLANIADGFLHHDRDIQRPVDDPVHRLIHKQARPLRLGRGNAPLELELPFTLAQPVLATGGHMKNSVALAWDKRIVISPHIGDLTSPRSQQVFAQAIHDLQQLYHVEAQALICDRHPAYASSRWARTSGLPLIEVGHHHAHAAVLSGEYPDESRWLAFTWDGVGLGSDDTFWGGEALLGHAGNWQRVASMQPFSLPGGDKASREPWRSAASLCWQTDTPWQPDVEGWPLLQQAWQQGLNSPTTTAVGRLFDAAAALLGLVDTVSYEGQAPMQLEALAMQTTAEAIAMPLKLDGDNIWRSDWSVLLPMLLDDELTKEQRAACFHESLAVALLEHAKQVREHYGDFCVGLSGGVFQNKYLTERLAELLTGAGFRYAIPVQVPMNDAGLCYGQVIEAMAPVVKQAGKRPSAQGSV
jgi:hydrogenase maturation protein HypF